MYLGRIVEEADAEQIFRRPGHPYTQALLASILPPEPGRGIPDTQLGSSYPNPIDPPEGCHFHPRCAHAMPVCRVDAPVLSTRGRDRLACHLQSEATDHA
jgi:peptide/nickel transport system ATP-binding protein